MISDNIFKDNSDKGKSITKNEVGKNDILILQKFMIIGWPRMNILKFFLKNKR